MKALTVNTRHARTLAASALLGYDDAELCSSAARLTPIAIAYHYYSCTIRALMVAMVPFVVGGFPFCWLLEAGWEGGAAQVPTLTMTECRTDFAPHEAISERLSMSSKASLIASDTSSCGLLNSHT